LRKLTEALSVFDRKVFLMTMPRSLFGVIEFSCASRLFPEDVINVFESLFEHELL